MWNFWPTRPKQVVIISLIVSVRPERQNTHILKTKQELSLNGVRWVTEFGRLVEYLFKNVILNVTEIYLNIFRYSFFRKLSLLSIY